MSLLRNKDSIGKKQNMILRCKRGFTLMEAVAVLVILAVVAAIAIPTASHYIKLAEFRKNEANAKTAYLAAESVLTWYRTSGEWEAFRAQIEAKGTVNDTFAEGDPKNGRIYAVTLNSSKSSEVSGSGELVKALLKDSSYDGDFLSGAIAIEVDVETGLVYSAFYATRCEKLAYDSNPPDGVLDISAAEGNRAYDSRRDRLLGYYSTEDVANVVDLNPVNLKVTSINLVNSETLSLNWSSNSRHQNEDVNFNITFYKKTEDAEDTVLFSTQINKNILSAGGWAGSQDSPSQSAALALKDGAGNEIGTWNFPLLYLNSGSGQNGRFSLILDAMMSADLMESLEAKADPAADDALYRSSSTSITRLRGKIPDLETPQDIYAVIEAEPYYAGMQGDLREYNKSLPVKSNTENTLFAAAKEEAEAGGDTLKAEISRYRHLSNIRYYAADKKADFTLTGRSIDWTAAGAGLYGLSEDTALGTGAQKLIWRPSLTGEAALAFPSVPLLSAGHTLTGKGSAIFPVLASDVSLSNLYLGKESVPADSQIEALYGTEAEKHYSRYMGLFGEVEGTIENVVFQNPLAELVGEGEAAEDEPLPNVKDLDNLYGVGILCGRSQGRLSDIAVKVTDKKASVMTVSLADRETETGARDRKPAGVGGIVGVIALNNTAGGAAGSNNALARLVGSDLYDTANEQLMEKLTVEGSIRAELPTPKKVTEIGEDQEKIMPEAMAEGYSYGVGGIFGYAYIGGNIKLKNCENHAGITGNLFTGGVGGQVTGDYAPNTADTDAPSPSGLEACKNDGLILCAQAAAREDKEAELTGRYFGGILGYGSQVEIHTSSSASGRAAGYKYMKDGFTQTEKDETLLGQYVGGIIGYGNSSHLAGCETERGGYILGSDYVGGIAGGLSNDIKQVITGANELSVTTNAGYVIGNSYVGGIVGKNGGFGIADESAQTVVHNCVNNGVVAGYGACIGGIVGYNGQNGVLEDCASYLSDHDHSIYNTIVKNWRAEGDCAGGLAGYNNGRITFNKEGQAVSVKSVSGIVTGGNFVGGIIGFNDTAGILEAEYELIGGQIYGTGTGIGGAVGLNASVQLLDAELSVRPSGVTGEYGTGGVIGVNVVALAKDTEASGLTANNGIGSISGTAFTGGVIGYQRTYTEEQIQDIAIPDNESGPEGSRLFQYLFAETGEGFEGEALLPKLGNGSLPTRVMASENECKLTITNKDNNKDSLNSANNNIPIRGYAYIGGVVGYCERESLLVLRNCRNSAEISRLGSREGIALKAYLEWEDIDEAAAQIEGAPRVYMIGGIIGANMENQIIDHCVNTGNMRGFQGLGGIVGFNAGGVFNCALENNFGNAELDYIGGIAGLNVHVDAEDHSYTDVNGQNWPYQSGIIAKCSTGAGRTISGRSYVGGVAGFNLLGGILTENTSSAGVTAAGSYAGGIAGGNAGRIETTADSGTSRTVTGTNGSGIGGLVGYNRPTGIISVKDNNGGSDEVVAVGAGVRVTGQSQVGGIIGINEGILSAENLPGKTVYLTARAEEVRALSGEAGGIAGVARGAGGNIIRARNRCDRVTADKGTAGGIVAVNGRGMELKLCENLGNVNSDSGHAGGIAAENAGTIADCTVGAATGSITVNSNGVEEIGAVCAWNTGEIRIDTAGPIGGKETVTLTGSASKAGGVSGVNEGSILGTGTITNMPKFSSLRGSRLTIGGVAGENGENGAIQGITVNGVRFEGFSNYQYLGGIAGRNLSTVPQGFDGTLADSAAGIKDCKLVNGTITEKSGAAGNCYGGIAGINSGVLSGCEVTSLNMTVQGVYTATSTSTAKEKEASATHTGGVAGKNEEDAWITGCFISVTAGRTSKFTVENGMAGAIAGYNKGTISLSGDISTKNLMDGIGKPDPDSKEEFNAAVAKLRENAGGLSAEPNYVNWRNNNTTAELELFTYHNTNTRVDANRTVSMIMKTNGNLGGITAYNAPTGALDRCATGNWYLSNKSGAIGVGTGGIIGMNESEDDLSFLINQAFVGREQNAFWGWSQAKNAYDWIGATDRFAGGVIGNQNITTMSGWKLRACMNYGTVYCLWSHYAGGILGQWTGTGGTIEKCYNYGNLQTTYMEGWKGASAGIVAQLYHAYENNEYNIISCGNYGNIYGRTGENNNDCANDSAGILGNVTAYGTNNSSLGQSYTIQVLDCVNGSGVKIYSGSMASGIVGFFSSDKPATGNLDKNYIVSSTGKIQLRIERCRNFADTLNGKSFVGGILGERYGAAGAGNTTLKDCYSVNRNGSYNHRGYPIISYTTEGTNHTSIASANNYYMDETYFSGNTVENIGNGDNRLRVSTSPAYRISVDGSTYLAYLNRSVTTTTNNLRLDNSNDKLYSTRNREAGQLLFKISDNGHTDMAKQIVNKGSDFDSHVRPAYHKLEDSANLISLAPEVAVKRMKAPIAVDLNVSGNRVNIGVKPASGTDPFKYKATLYLDGEPLGDLKNFEFYTEDYSLVLSSKEAILANSGRLTIAVSACSMFNEVDDSETVDGEGREVKLLPAPELKIELVRDEKGGHTYRFWLDNIEDYTTADFIPEGTAGQIPASWQIQIKGTTETIQPVWNADTKKWKTASLYMDTTALSSNVLQQILVQATDDAGTGALASEEVSVPVYLPDYTPSMALSNTNPITAPSVRVTGDNLTNLSITVTLTPQNAGNVTTPPIYRAELIGTWDDETGTTEPNVVIKSTDILASANGSVSAVFNGLPEYMSCLKANGEPYVTNLQVRIWYAQPGLGNVYTYYSPEGDYAGLYTLNGTANIKVLDEENTTITTDASGNETVTPAWITMDSPVLDNTNTFGDYRATLPGTGSLFTWLPAPKLADAPEFAENTGPEQNRMQYTFKWDEAATGSDQNDYIVSLTGLVEQEDGNLSEVSIVTNQENHGNTLVVDAENWTYEKVKLTVTRRGTEGTQIGLTASREYPVKQRLPRPAQPTVTIPDTNELNYTVEWVPIVPETGCESYAVYVQPYKDDGTLDTAQKYKDDVPVTAKNEDGSYGMELPLEKFIDQDGTEHNYAGRKILVYLAAQPADDSAQYVRSVDGVTYELDVPSRIPAPVINSWDKNWEYDRSAPKGAADFQSADGTSGEGLKVIVNPNTAPPGDSSYLLKAYVFKTKDDAEAAKGILTSDKNDLLNGMDGYLASYPIQVTNIFTPVAMEAMNPVQYRHTLQGLSAEYAGKWILFYVRVSSGNGQISSEWVANTPWQLPYVKLDEPELGSSTVERGITVESKTNPDLPAEQADWTASHKLVEWSSVELADAYEVTLTPKADGTIQEEYRLRIYERETDDGNGGTVKSVELYAADIAEPSNWIPVTRETDDTGKYIFDLNDYSMDISGSYYDLSGIQHFYNAAAHASLEAVWEEGTGFHYTLILPDIAGMTEPEDGITISEDDQQPTASVTVISNVDENIPDDRSDAYVESNEAKVEF